MSYAWIGAPTPFNGTNSVTGGDSGQFKSRRHPTERYTDMAMCSQREPEPMVPARRPGLHPRGFGHGVDHGSWPGLPLLRSGSQKVGPLAHLGLHVLVLRHNLPMVLLGLLARLWSLQEWLHRQPRQVWSQGCAWRSQPGQPSDS